MYLDSHAHLEAEHFGADLTRVIEDAHAAGVTRILAVGTGTPADDHIDATISVADRYDFIYATVGVHPHEAGLASLPFLQDVRRKADHPKVIAWGEVGLDYHYNYSSRETQSQILEEQIKLAEDADLPVVFHCREAEQDLVTVLERHARNRSWGVLHCFTGPRWFAHRALDLGMFISFSGILTFKNASELRQIAVEIPASRLLVETDSPYLAPVPHRGRRNEPKYVREVTALLAELRGVTVPALLEQLHLNFESLFGVDTPRNAG